MPLEAPPENIKTYVRQVYQRLAIAGSVNLSRAPIPSGEDLARLFGYETDNVPVAKKAWNLFAGCGNPLASISIQPKWTVLDLGCGVGIDSQMAALSLRRPGRVISLDFTPEFLHLARAHASVQVLDRCSWVAGDGEHIPLRPQSVHLVMANGSFNLMPDKELVLAEVHRILVPGGRLTLTDLIRVGEVPAMAGGHEDAWTWCVGGALSASEYDLLLRKAGFSRWQLRTTHVFGPLAAAHVLARKPGGTGYLVNGKRLGALGD
jgi:arsenite methyltransferase